MMDKRVSPWSIGSSLYIPATHSELVNVIVNQKYQGLRSLIICLEDAIKVTDLEFAKQNLKQIMSDIAQQIQQNPCCKAHFPLIFIRPRNMEIAKWIMENVDLEHISGFVIPKFDITTIDGWWEILQNSHLYMMPTLENHDVYNVIKMQQLSDILSVHPCRDKIIVLRIGGNDLMNGLRLRRDRTLTLYDGPIGYLIKMLVTVFASNGFYLTAPVCEHFENDALLEQEVNLDLLHGLVGKTIIHPSQISVIDKLYMVSEEHYFEAQQILNATEAVFKVNGSMCEPTTQYRWAQDVIERAKYFGIK